MSLSSERTRTPLNGRDVTFRVCPKGQSPASSGQIVILADPCRTTRDKRKMQQTVAGHRILRRIWESETLIRQRFEDHRLQF